MEPRYRTGEAVPADVPALADLLAELGYPAASEEVRERLEGFEHVSHRFLRPIPTEKEEAR